MKIYPAILILFLAVTACDTGNRIEQTKALKSEIKSVEIKRVTNSQLIYSANEWGKKIIEISEKSLAKELANSTDGNVKCKNPGQIPVIAALEKEYGMEVNLLFSADITNKKLHRKEREILDAYMYSAKNKAPIGENLQQLDDSLFVYNAPLTPESPVYDQCAPKDDVPFAVWRILFRKKDIIRKLDAKQLNK